MIEVEVLRVFFDFVSASAMVILINKEKNKVMPIWIGIFEAQAIQSAIEADEFRRPLTHELLKNVITALSAEVKHILITDIADNTFYSRIYIKKGEELVDIDSRPSDAICLAVKSKRKVFVSDKVYGMFEDRKVFEKKLREDFYNLFLSNINKEDLKKA